MLIVTLYLKYTYERNEVKMNDLSSLLFETNAFRICEENKPFFYTSGKIGPYFVNGHFLYGSEKEANSLLDFINDELENVEKSKIPQDIFAKVLYQYENNVIYSTIINHFVFYIKEHIPLESIDYISGGERRDWYFSNIVAYLLKKPHLTIYKDLTVVESTYNFSSNETVTNINKTNILHVADLLNQASSFFKSWIPAIQNVGGKILWSAVAIDRDEGGHEKLEENNIESLALIHIDSSLFNHALKLNIITENQLKMLEEFKKNPYESMRNFLIHHPEFLENALKSDTKTAKRAKTCIDDNLYNLK